MWEAISKGNIWEGTIKNINKSKETYFINTKIIPLMDDTGKNILEYISIRFLVTEEENLRRAQNKRFLEQITTYKKEISSLKKEKEQVENKIESITVNAQYMKEKNITYEKKIKNLLQQVAAYEQNNLELSKVELMMKQDKSKQFDLINREMLKLRTLNRNLIKEIEALQKLVLEKEKHIEELEQKKIDYEKRIANLLDLVNNLQKEVKILKGEELAEK